MLPLPALNPLHQSCHPRSQGVPATFWGHEGPVPSVSTCCSPWAGCLCHSVSPRFVPSSLVLPFPWALLRCLLSSPALGRCHRSQRCQSQLTVGCARPLVCFACSPWLCRQHTPVSQTCLGSFSPVCEQSWAQLLPEALLLGCVPSSAGIAAFESASVTDLAAVNPTA